jgi:hypothetical protein
MGQGAEKQAFSRRCGKIFASQKKEPHGGSQKYNREASNRMTLGHSSESSKTG